MAHVQTFTQDESSQKVPERRERQKQTDFRDELLALASSPSRHTQLERNALFFSLMTVLMKCIRTVCLCHKPDTDPMICLCGSSKWFHRKHKVCLCSVQLQFETLTPHVRV